MAYSHQAKVKTGQRTLKKDQRISHNDQRIFSFSLPLLLGVKGSKSVKIQLFNNGMVQH